jgi:transcriptional regulator with XRE-family HTH domain
MTLGTRIKQARTSKKWSLQKLADEMGVTKQLVWQWERDETDPRKHIQQLSQHLDVPVEYFYGSKRAPGVLATKISQLGTDQQAMIEAMVDALLNQQDQDHPRVKRS